MQLFMSLIKEEMAGHVQKQTGSGNQRNSNQHRKLVVDSEDPEAGARN